MWIGSKKVRQRSNFFYATYIVGCGGVVGGNGFGVVVDDNCLVTGIFNGGYCVNGGIVEFNTLADTDRACTENDDLLFIGYDGSVFAGIGRIEIRDICAAMEGINHSVNREHVKRFSHVENTTKKGGCIKC